MSRAKGISGLCKPGSKPGQAQGIFRRSLAVFLLLAAFPMLLFLSPSVCLAGDTADVSVNAVILSKNQCKFNAPTTVTLALGTLDAGNPVDVTMNFVPLTFVCNGNAPLATFLIVKDGGLYGGNQMKHETLDAFIPYEMTLAPPASPVAKGVDHQLGITVKVLGSDYQLGPAGNYSDTVQVDITP